MNFLFLTTMLVMIFTMISSSMTTSLKTTAFAYSMLKQEVDAKIILEDKIEREKYKTQKSATKKSDENRAKERETKTFQFRKVRYGPNSKLNLYPLTTKSYSQEQRKELLKTFKNLLTILYGKKLKDPDAFANKVLLELKKTRSIAKIFQNDAESRQTFLSLCGDKRRSLLKYVTVQDEETVQGICLNGVSKEVLKAFVGDKTYKRIEEIEKEAYFAGRHTARIKQEETKDLLSAVQASMIRFDLTSTKNHREDTKVTEGGRIIIQGATKKHT